LPPRQGLVAIIGGEDQFVALSRSLAAWNTEKISYDLADPARPPQSSLRLATTGAVSWVTRVDGKLREENSATVETRRWK